MLLGAPPPGGLPGVAEVDRGRRLDALLAVRADLPERFERLLAVHPGLLQLGRADRADEEGRVDDRWRALLAGDVAAFSRAADTLAMPRVVPAPKIDKP